MALQAGIVGLPNVGKSTLFNAVSNSAKAQARREKLRGTKEKLTLIAPGSNYSQDERASADSTWRGRCQ